MKVCLLNIKTPRKQNMDCMGGFGVGSSFGRSWFTRLVALGKRNGVNLPLMDYGYLAGMYKGKGDEVILGGPETKADLYYLHHSLVGYSNECEAIRDIPEGKLRKVGPMSSEKVSAIDSPFPAWEYFNYKAFSYYPSLKVKPVIPVLASEGCKFTCSYCPYRAHYGEWKPRPVRDVLDELFIAKVTYGAKGIVFRDPLFSGDMKRTRELCQGMKPLALEWACETRLECLDEETVAAMARAGCKSIHVGIESASKWVLENVGRKNPSVQVMADLIRYIQGQGVKILAFFILGLPDDTREGCEATIRLAVRLNPDLAEFFIATPYPNTPFYEKVKGRLTTLDFSLFDGFTPVLQHDNLEARELLDLRERAYRKFYMRPGFARRYLWNH